MWRWGAGGGGRLVKTFQKRSTVWLGSNQLCSFHPYSTEPLSKGRLHGFARAGIPSLDGMGRLLISTTVRGRPRRGIQPVSWVQRDSNPSSQWRNCASCEPRYKCLNSDCFTVYSSTKLVLNYLCNYIIYYYINYLYNYILYYNPVYLRPELALLHSSPPYP